MKRITTLSMLLFSAAYLDATFGVPQGSLIKGAGSSLANEYMQVLIAKYNSIFPCPRITYKPFFVSAFSSSLDGVNRVLNNTVEFAVADQFVSESTTDSAPDCLLQIPFILNALVVIYRVPGGTITTQNWKGFFNIGPADLCDIYTDDTPSFFYDTITNFRPYNGFPAPGAGLSAPSSIRVVGYARSDSADETALFLGYLRCAGTCGTFLSQSNVSSNPQGPFCGTSPGRWSTFVRCVEGDEGIAQAVLAADGLAGRPNGAIGYVTLATALKYGFDFASGPLRGFPIGIAGLFKSISGTGATDIPANYTQPTITAVQNAVPACGNVGQFLCTVGAYPIVLAHNFVLYATQPDSLIACNLAQFIQFTLTQGQKLKQGIPLGDCITESFAQLDNIQSAICTPCNEICNPCANQPCPIVCPPCKA